MIRLASNSCLGPVEPLLEPPQNIHGAEILNKIMAYIDKKITYEHDDNGKNKKFAYKPNTVSNGHDPYPNVIPIGPIPHERPWWLEEEDDDESKNYPQGLESLVASRQIPSASIKDQFQTYYSVLSRYFTPSDLRGKSLMELDRMLQMFIKSNGGLF